MELMKNPRASQMKICMEMSSQGFLCCHFFLWHGYSVVPGLLLKCILRFQLKSTKSISHGLHEPKHIEQSVTRFTFKV